jgi:hypothetical protein
MASSGDREEPTLPWVMDLQRPCCKLTSTCLDTRRSAETSTGGMGRGGGGNRGGGGRQGGQRSGRERSGSSAGQALLGVRQALLGGGRPLHQRAVRAALSSHPPRPRPVRAGWGARVVAAGARCLAIKIARHWGEGWGVGVGGERERGWGRGAGGRGGANKFTFAAGGLRTDARSGTTSASSSARRSGRRSRARSPPPRRRTRRRCGTPCPSC